MLRKILLVIVLILLVGAAAFAQTSAGVILGEPTGLSAKQWVSDTSSFDAALAWSFLGTGAIYVHVDYQLHFDQFDVNSGTLLTFAGIGGRIYAGSDLKIGGRIPLGVVYEFDQAPIEVFLELAPGLNLFPATGFDVSGGLGIRYRL